MLKYLYSALVGRHVSFPLILDSAATRPKRFPISWLARRMDEPFLSDRRYGRIQPQ
jgi:hypothetical protein